MKLFNGIIGVLSIFGALYCIFWQGTSFLHYGWIVTLVLLLWGICGIATYAIDRKENQKKDGNAAATGISGLVLGIVGCVFSILSIFNPIIQGLFLFIVKIIFTVFMFVSGIRLIVYASKTKKAEDSKGWAFSLVLGIVLLLIGIGGTISCITLQALGGVPLGIMLGVFGCALLASIFRHDNVGRYDNL